MDNGSTREGEVSYLDEELQLKFGQDYLRLEDGEQAPAHLPCFTFLASKSNDGYAAGNNKGLKLAYADDEVDKVLILNPDILFVEDILPKLTHDLSTLPQSGIVSPLLYKKGLKEIDVNCARNAASVCRITRSNFLDPIKWTFKIKDKSSTQHLISEDNIGNLPDFMQITLPSGSCMLLKKDVMERIGSFDPGTFLYYEENILAKKLEAIGLTSYIDTTARCIHLGASTIGASPSRYVLKRGFQSQKYYVMHWSGASLFSKALYLLSYGWMKAYIGIKCFIRRR